ncbi:hypothetical protein HQ447_18345 [bacterium]|nr:hypothetical protein [bacterium]
MASTVEAKPRKIKTPKIVDPNRDLKWGIWAYFLLLIFEGALRKWFLPFLATPLLVARDPLALWLVVVALSRGTLKLNGYILTMGVIGIVGTFTALTLGHGNLAVAIYGARILLFHFPLMFMIGRVFDRNDAVQIGKATLWIAIPMTVLIALQFYSPQSAWVNRGVGGDLAGAGFSGSMGFFRPPGTFSFTNGTTLFYSFLTPFVFYFWLESKTIPKLILLIATLGLLASIPLSISRTLLFQVGVTFAFTILAISRRPKYLGPLVMGLAAAAIALAILSTTPFYDTASQAFSARFEIANEVEGGLEGVFLDRFLGGLIGAVIGSGDQPFFGFGQGKGTNVGSMLLSGTTVFLISEGEWGRVIGELGPILGLVLIGCRLVLSGEVATKSYERLVKGDLLPWLLLSFGLITLAQGGWAQPTSLGFGTMIGGLLLASLEPPAKGRRPKKRAIAGKVPIVSEPYVETAKH